MTVNRIAKPGVNEQMLPVLILKPTPIHMSVCYGFKTEPEPLCVSYKGSRTGKSAWQRHRVSSLPEGVMT